MPLVLRRVGLASTLGLLALLSARAAAPQAPGCPQGMHRRSDGACAPGEAPRAAPPSAGQPEAPPARPGSAFRSEYERACSARDPAACESAARQYLEWRDYPRALVFARRACVSSYHRGCAVLGELQTRGQGGPVDFLRGVASYELACNDGALDACAEAGRLWRTCPMLDAAASQAAGVRRESAPNNPSAVRYYDPSARSWTDASQSGCDARADLSLQRGCFNNNTPSQSGPSCAVLGQLRAHLEDPEGASAAFGHGCVMGAHVEACRGWFEVCGQSARNLERCRAWCRDPARYDGSPLLCTGITIGPSRYGADAGP